MAGKMCYLSAGKDYRKTTICNFMAHWEAFGIETFGAPVLKTEKMAKEQCLFNDENPFI